MMRVAYGLESDIVGEVEIIWFAAYPCRVDVYIWLCGISESRPDVTKWPALSHDLGFNLSPLEWHRALLMYKPVWIYCKIVSDGHTNVYIYLAYLATRLTVLKGRITFLEWNFVDKMYVLAMERDATDGWNVWLLGRCPKWRWFVGSWCWRWRCTERADLS